MNSVNSLVAEGGTDNGEPHMPCSWCRLLKHNKSSILEKYLWQQDNLKNEQAGSKSQCGHYVGTRSLSRSKQLLTSKSSPQSSRREGHVTALKHHVALQRVLSVLRTRRVSCA